MLLRIVLSSVVIGVIQAQTAPPPPAYTYSIVSIHKSAPGDGETGWQWKGGPQGGLWTLNSTVADLITLAYQIPDYRLKGGLGWASSEHYDVVLTPAEPEIPEDTTANAAELARRARNWQRLQAVLRDRFGLVLRLETHELPIYSLVQAGNGVTLPRVDGERSNLRVNGPGKIKGTAQELNRLTTLLSEQLGRPVIDETGLIGQYNFTLEWSPDPNVSTPSGDAGTLPAIGASLETALKQQMGLRLESKKGPVQVYIIEKVERPTEN